MIQTIPIVFQGGLNLVSSTFNMQAGEAVELNNYEVNPLGRYQRIMGYESFDGQPAPSEIVESELTGYPFATDELLVQAVTNERDARRTAIQPIEGSGAIRGVVRYNGSVYAFRDNTQGDQCYMWKATSTGWQKVTTPFLFAGGKYEFVTANFGASSNSIKLYGVDGKNHLFEFDGYKFIQIKGAIPNKFPTHLEVLSSQVMVNSYEGGTFVFSAVGDPTDFLNGGEIGTGDEITALDLQANNTMAVFCRNRTYMLYGSSKADFELQDLSKNTGAVDRSVQTIGDSIYLDDRGLTRLNRVQQFGNFASATISQKVEPLLSKYVRRVTASFAIREKNQYRLCFDDGTGLICSFFGSEVSGFSTFDYGKVVRCAYSGEDENGKEVLYFGSDDGYVYQMQKGFSFDGQAINHKFIPTLVNLNAPEVKKRWRKAVVEIDTLSTALIRFEPEFDYPDPAQFDQTIDQTSQTMSYIILAKGGQTYVNQNTYNEQLVSQAKTYTADVYVDGVSRNMSMTFSGNAIEEPPHILNSAVLHFSPRGRRR
jgi:hypothetical protein